MDKEEVGGVNVSRLIEDAQLAAFLMYKGFKLTPLRLSENKNYIAFEVVGDEWILNEAINYFFRGYTVDITEYIKCLKTIKSQMYSMKSISVNKKLEI